MRTLVCIAFVVTLLCVCGNTIRAETETFDTQESVTANGWVEFQSRENQFDFGFSATNNAGGAGAGEGGGLMARSGPRGYFADVSDTRRDLSNDLVASGRIKWQDQNFDGEWFFGWFDAEEAENDNQAFLGFNVLEQRPQGWRILASINESGTPPTDQSPPCNACDGELRFVPDDSAIDFSLRWDADGGNAPGEGKLTLSLATVDGSETISSTDGTVASSTISTAIGPDDAIEFNAFGLLANSQGPRNDLGNFWFDDLFYTLDEGLSNPGDFNEDGVLDLIDFNILADNFGTGKFFSEGDINFDGHVDLDDFVEFRILFQAAQGQAQAASVPEPTGLAILAAGTALLLITRRRQARIRVG